MNNQREIKFRVWNKIQNNWSKGLGAFAFAPNIDLSSNKQYIIQQFTGLKDKNGTEIYEGDILKFNKRGGIISNNNIYIDSVEWNNHMFCWGFAKELTALGYYSCFEKVWQPKIIGNIFENPELLK